MPNFSALAGIVRGIILALPDELFVGDVYLFGSILNSSSPNDIDVLLVINEDIVPPAEAYKLSMPLSKAIEVQVNLKLDLTILTRTELEKSKFVALVNALLIRTQSSRSPPSCQMR